MNKYNITVSDDKILITTPYNPQFVATLKASVGGVRWDGSRKVWVADANRIDDVRAVMRKVYGMDDSPIDANDVADVIITLPWGARQLHGPVVMMGRTIAVATGRDSGARIAADVVLMEGKAESGGSAKNWCTELTNGAVVKLTNVPRALIDSRAGLPDDATVEVLQSAQPTALQALETRRAQLLAELAKVEADIAAQAKNKTKPPPT